VKKALPGVSSDEVKKYTEDKFIVVDGIRLEEGDLVVKRSLKEGGSPSLETNTDQDVLTILDTEIYPELAHEGVAREIINRVQRLRKKAGLATTDDVKMEYKILSDPENIGLEQVFSGQTAIMEKALRRPVDKQPSAEVQQDATIAEEEQEIQKATFMLRLLKL